MKGQDFDERLGKQIKIPNSIAKTRSLASIALDHRFKKDFVFHAKRAQFFQDIHRGERCFLIGSGPSLNETNLGLIRYELSYGVNTLYRGLDKFKIKCKYWGAVDGKLFAAQHKELLNLKTTLFLAEHAGQRFLEQKETYLKNSRNAPIVLRNLGSMNIWNKFSEDITKGVYSGGSSIIQALQVLYYMGFQEVVLIGCDCGTKDGHYRFEDTPVANPMGKGICGDWKYLIDAFKVCKKAFEDDDRTILNATVGGELEVFERIRLEDAV